MMENKITTILLIGVVFIGTNCQKVNNEYKEKVDDPELIHKSMKQLTDIIVYDIFSPPVASRVYVYPSIAAYEAMVHDDSSYQSLAGQLNGLTGVPKPDPEKEISFPIASVQAFLKTGKYFIFSEDRLEAFQKKVYQQIEDMDVPEDVFENSIEYGSIVSDHILAWADKDNYKQTRTFPKYTVTDEAWRWQPTPPVYMEAIEPHWNKIRTFVLDSSTQYVPEPPTKYNMQEESRFYEELMEVYEVGNELTEEQSEIAKFWDCNPYVANTKGHMMFATKKITPGGHWIGITAIASRKANANMMKTVAAYAKVSIALADAFISCWDEKYRSSLVRPETLINRHIDEDWAPLLQTPPFPEYTSGHSVISAAAALTLTDIFGEPFHFLDTTEVEYGLPARSFNSFVEASNEAAISRLYGGIHYRPACEIGIHQGRKVGSFIIDNIQMRKQGENSLAVKKKEKS